MAEKYDPNAIEKKWRQKWAEAGIYATKEATGKPKSYVLDMFPYPSGEGLHVGHPKGYIATDVYSRKKRMEGFSVLHPMGWDAFGLPAENYALANKVHPRVAVEKNIARFKEQLEGIGFDYDWSREINTTDPEYYKWTQWIFLKLFEKGLAYQSDEPINWCPSCMTGLSNEDLETHSTSSGQAECERCGSVVEKKKLRQWVLKITDYAERMLKDLELLPKWPEHIKELQRNWIGKSEGVNYRQKIKGTDIEVVAYDSVPQTFMAQTFAVIAPEHPLLSQIIAGTPQEKEVEDFVRDFSSKKARLGFELEKTMEGIFTGRYVEDPFGTGDLPIWVASFVVADYGTGFVNCSAHDERDFAFAKKYGIPLRPVMFPPDHAEAEKVRNLEYCYHHAEEGVLELPAQCAGRRWGEVRNDIIEYIEQESFGKRAVQYKLRDWVFSRQRYWGEPIPIIHCEKCGAVAVPEKDLPVLLPEVEHYEPSGTGESPLAAISEWVNTACPKCGGAGKRETNTMPQWAGSSWYYIAYCISEHLKSQEPISEEIQSAEIQNKIKYWLPVDMYVGGAEHATRHLIYARFWHKFLYDISVVSTVEPFDALHSVGLIHALDGRKMSKRFGNVINPDSIVGKYGADTLRVYEMFMGPFQNAIAWNTQSLIGSNRFLERVWKMGEAPKKEKSRGLEALVHRTVKKVGEDIETFKFNTAIAQMMILLNAAEKEGMSEIQWSVFLRLLAPFAPHIAEELWSRGEWAFFIHTAEWPVYDPAKIVEDTVTIAVQFNGKLRTVIEVPRDTAKEELETLARDALGERLSGQSVTRIITVPNRLVNVVVDPKK